MLRFNRSFVILVLAALLAACAGPAAAPTATPVPPTTTPISPAPTAAAAPMATATDMVKSPEMRYSGEGQYKVGSKDFAVQEGDETLNVSAFYPGLNATAPDTTHGPYPLVVFSPGLGTSPVSYMNWLRPIVSHGFVILASSPRGEKYEEFWAGAATRPQDIRRIIDYAGKLTAPGGQLAGMIDTERIGVVGHSSGGWTALMEGGAQMDFGWCAAHPDVVAKSPMSNCPQFVPHQQEIAAMLGLKSAPAGMWPPMNDPRVAAVIAASPDGDIWGAEYGGVAGVKVPTLIMAGSADIINAPELCAYPIYEHLGSTRKSLVVFEQGTHDLGWNFYYNAITHIMTAFLLAELKGDAEAAKALLPQNVTVPGVKYETTTYGAAPTAKLDDATSVPPTPTPPTATPTSPAAAEASPTPAAAGKIETVQGKITSNALAGNLLGDPATRTYSVLLPPSYGASDKRYPVVYVLHWYTGKDYSMVGPMLAPYMSLLREDKVQEMIFVFPDASNTFGGSQYLSSPTIGDYETYVTQEFVELVDATYRTIPDRNSRGITGCSMGGDGSIYLALKYPGVFSVAAPASATYDWARDPVLWEEGPELLLKDPPKPKFRTLKSE